MKRVLKRVGLKGLAGLRLVDLGLGVVGVGVGEDEVVHGLEARASRSWEVVFFSWDSRREMWVRRVEGSEGLRGGSALGRSCAGGFMVWDWVVVMEERTKMVGPT